MRVHFITGGGSGIHQQTIPHKKTAYQESGTDDEIFEPARIHFTEAGLPAKNGCDPLPRIPHLDRLIPERQAKAGNAELVSSAERLEVLAEKAGMVEFRDFTQVAAKLTAAMQDVKRQFMQQTMIAGLELRSDTSLTADCLLATSVHLTKQFSQRLCIPVVPGNSGGSLIMKTAACS